MGCDSPFSASFYAEENDYEYEKLLELKDDRTNEEWLAWLEKLEEDDR